MKRRVIALAAALCLLLTLAPVCALAASSAPEQSAGQQKPEKTEVEKQRDRLEQLMWYVWLSRKYATMTFEDVPTDSWFYSGVFYVWQNSLMSGVSATRFAPEEPTNRAMAWTVLARMHKADTQAEEGAAWYEPGVNWAVKQGLGDGTDPLGGLTREYLAEMLWRCAGGPITPADLSGFSDRRQVSSYAENGVQWAVATGVLQGADGKLLPQGGLSRAELAEMVTRYKAIMG